MNDQTRKTGSLGRPSTLTQHGVRSGASLIACADVADQAAFLSELDGAELRALPFLFEF